MTDKDLNHQINVKMDDCMHHMVDRAADLTGMWKGEIVRRCISRCIRQDKAPWWKRWIVKLIRY